MRPFEKEQEEVSKMAKQIFDMEKAGDSSMRGVWMDRVVTEYVELHFPKIIEFYDIIKSQQTEEKESYGDFDLTCEFLPITNAKGRYPTIYNYTFEGLLLNDIFCGNKFIIVKEFATHKENDSEFLNEISFHVRKVDYNKEIKSINYNKYITENPDYMVVSFDVKQKRIVNQHHRGMAYRFQRFQDFMFALKQPVNELIEPNK